MRLWFTVARGATSFSYIRRIRLQVTRRRVNILLRQMETVQACTVRESKSARYYSSIPHEWEGREREDVAEDSANRTHQRRKRRRTVLKTVPDTSPDCLPETL